MAPKLNLKPETELTVSAITVGTVLVHSEMIRFCSLVYCRKCARFVVLRD